VKTRLILFRREGKWLVLSRGIVALLLMIVAIAFSFSTIVLDPSSEGEQLPVKVTRSTKFPYIGWPTNDLYIFVVRLKISKMLNVLCGLLTSS